MFVLLSMERMISQPKYASMSMTMDTMVFYITVVQTRTIAEKCSIEACFITFNFTLPSWLYSYLFYVANEGSWKLKLLQNRLLIFIHYSEYSKNRSSPLHRYSKLWITGLSIFNTPYILSQSILNVTIKT